MSRYGLKEVSLGKSLGEALEKLKFLAGSPIGDGFHNLRPIIGFLEQLKNLDESELKKAPERIHLIRALLAANNQPSLADFKNFLVQLPSWLPRPLKVPTLKGNWKQKMLKREVDAWKYWSMRSVRSKLEGHHEKFFIDMLAALGREKIELYLGYGLEPCLLPKLVLLRDQILMPPNGWILPSDEYWYALKKDRIMEPDTSRIRECAISPSFCLVDTRRKPMPRALGGGEEWADDLLMASVISRLRDEEALPFFKRPEKGSRYELSGDHYENVIAPLYAKALGLPDDFIVRLETVPEWMALNQYKKWPRNNDAATSPSVMFHERINVHGKMVNLRGGEGDVGGQSHIRFISDDDCELPFTLSGRLIAVRPWHPHDSNMVVGPGRHSDS